MGYLCGSFLTSEVVSLHYTGRPASQIGSKNPGMANVMSQIGKIPGILVLLGDILKTALAIELCFLFFHQRIGCLSLSYAGIGSVLGHDFSFWKRGRGGKGVTSTCTWFILAFGGWGILADMVGAITVIITGWLPLGAILIPVAMLPAAFLYSDFETFLLVLISCVVMCNRHRHGITRILEGKEKRNFILKSFKASPKDSG